VHGWRQGKDAAATGIDGGLLVHQEEERLMGQSVPGKADPDRFWKYYKEELKEQFRRLRK